MTYAGITLRIEGHIATIELAASSDAGASLLGELLRACATLSDADGVSVVILVAPIDSLTCIEAGPTAAEVASAFETLPQPIIAAIEGGASGVGLEIALACDVRVASDTATFSMPQIASGSMPSAGGTQRLPRIVGRTRAAEMILLGGAIDAQAALACGLLNAVTPMGGAAAEAARLAGRIAKQGPLAVRYAKEAILRGLDMPLEQALRYETDLTVILQTTDDRAEGVRAFNEKRRPKFDGR